jgi:hypothetical protein
MDQFTMKESIEKRDAETLKLQQATPSPNFDWEKLIRDLVLKHPKEIKSLIADLDPTIQNTLFALLEAKYPSYAGIAKLILGNNGNGNRNAVEAQGNDIDGSNPLDDNDPTKSYDIPDTEILDEIREFASSLHLGGYGWAAISDQIFSKYDVDWHPMKVKDIVLKSLAWGHTLRRNDAKEVAKVIVPEVAKVLPEPHRGLIRNVLHKLW